MKFRYRLFVALIPYFEGPMRIRLFWIAMAAQLLGVATVRLTPWSALGWVICLSYISLMCWFDEMKFTIATAVNDEQHEVKQALGLKYCQNFGVRYEK